MADDFGTDVSTFPSGIDADWSLVSGARAIAESVLRLWLTERGTMLTDENAGIFVLGYLSGGLTADELEPLARQLELEALGEERVAACIVVVQAIGEGLQISGVITPIQGESFDFVFSLTADTIGVLLPEAA